MSNLSTKRGLLQIGPTNPYLTDWFPIDNAYGTDIFLYDAVAGVADYGINQATAGASNPILGVALDFARGEDPNGADWVPLGVDNGQNKPGYYAHSVYSAYQCWAKVCFDPWQLYWMVDDQGSAFGTNAAAMTMLFNTCNIKATPVGNAVSGESGMIIDSGTYGATTANQQLFIVGWKRTPDNSLLDVPLRWKVRINTYQFPQCTANSFAIGGAGV